MREPYMTRLRCRRLRGMQLLTLPNEVLVEIAKHLEPHDPSMGAFRMLGKSTRDLTMVCHKPTLPTYCGRIMELPWLHALWPGASAAAAASPPLPLGRRGASAASTG